MKGVSDDINVCWMELVNSWNAIQQENTFFAIGLTYYYYNTH